MPAADLLAALAQTPGVLLRPAEPLALHTPLRVGGPCEIWVEAADQTALREVLKALRKARLSHKIHWPFEDWLVRDGGLGGVVLRLGLGFDWLRRTPEAVVLGSATPFAALAALGEAPPWPALSTWAGTPGGLFARSREVALSGWVTRLRWLTGRGVEERLIPQTEEPGPLPDSGVLLEIELRPPPPRRGRRTPPPPAGAALADPEHPRDFSRLAGLLTRSELPGSRLRAWRWAESAPGVLVHRGGGTTADALIFIQAAKDRVERARGVDVDLTLPLLGHDRPPARKPHVPDPGP